MPRRVCRCGDEAVANSQRYAHRPGAANVAAAFPASCAAHGTVQTCSKATVPAFTPDPARIRAFKDAATFESWLAKHHAAETELWLKLHKKGSGLATVSYAEALDVALCWGWIDGLKKSFDDKSFLQRFTPRKANSLWSQINRGHVARLTKAGRMTKFGQAHIDAAKLNGRWDAAYAGQSTTTAPADLAAAIEANTDAAKTWATLSKQNVFACCLRVTALKTADARARKIIAVVAMLARGETFYSNTAKAIGK
jgi:uncharacterized protein YdeI (YjbR/CyaY-like superfamily)